MKIFSCAIHLTEITFTIPRSMHIDLYIIHRIEKKRQTNKQTKKETKEINKQKSDVFSTIDGH